MANVVVNSTDIQNIADAIRSKNGLATTYLPSQMPAAISAIPTGGGGSITADDIALRTISGNISGSASFIEPYAFFNCTSLTTVSFPACTSIGFYAFQFCSALTTASFPACTIIASSAFNNCTSLTTISFPVCTIIGSYAFQFCSALTTVSFPSCTSIGYYTFGSCISLTTASFSACTSIGSNAFKACYNLISLYLTNISSVPTLQLSAFSSTPIGGYTTSTGGVYGSVFVPSSLYQSFLTATNWGSISARIVSI